jgi:NDP-sugar pyrophosphorylase family protein
MLPVAILAGGLATRLRPLTETMPKALVDVDGEPFIAHQLRLLALNRIDRVTICAGHLGALIQEFVGDGTRFGVHATFAFDGPRLLGTAGALSQALPLLGDAFFVLYGDSYLLCNFARVQECFVESGKRALMTVFHNDGRWVPSNVELVNGSIVSYDKRAATPRMRHVDYGLGVFSHDALRLGLEGRASDLADLYRDLLRKDELAACEVHQRFYEIGSIDGLAETRHYLALRRGEATDGL